MATPYTAPVRSKAGLSGREEVVSVSATFTSTEIGALADGDIAIGILIPYGATITDIHFQDSGGDAHASAATLAWDIGFDWDPNYFTATPVSAANSSAAVQWRYSDDVANAAQYQVTGSNHQTDSIKDDTLCVLEVTLETVPATDAADTLTLTVNYIT